MLVAACLAVVGGSAWAALSAWRRGLDASLAGTGAELRRLADAVAWREGGSQEVRRELSGLRETVDRLNQTEGERRAREEAAWADVQRMSSVLVGGQRAGRAGENVLRDALACLPPSMVVTDFQVNGRVVEFGLVLPDGRRLPVDSKWPADRELQELTDTMDPVDRERLERIVERTVLERAEEVAGDRDPALAAPV